jgi:hypothetical protein
MLKIALPEMSSQCDIFQIKITKIVFQKMFKRFAITAARRSVAKVTSPAPAFSGTAVVNGGFEQISLQKFNDEVSSSPFFIIYLKFSYHILNS